jgi:hypothetical protein
MHKYQIDLPNSQTFHSKKKNLLQVLKELHIKEDLKSQNNLLMSIYIIQNLHLEGCNYGMSEQKGRYIHTLDNNPPINYMMKQVKKKLQNGYVAKTAI